MLQLQQHLSAYLFLIAAKHLELELVRKADLMSCAAGCRVRVAVGELCSGRSLASTRGGFGRGQLDVGSPPAACVVVAVKRGAVRSVRDDVFVGAGCGRGRADVTDVTAACREGMSKSASKAYIMYTLSHVWCA